MRALDSQFYAFFAVSLAGVVSGLLFDLLRVVRWRLRPEVTAAADLLYWALVTLVLGTGLFMGNWGDLRFYVLVALCAGAFLYFALAGPVVRWLLGLLVGTVLWTWGVLCELVGRLVVAPAAALALLLWRLLLWAGGSGWRLGRGAARAVGRPIRGVYRRARTGVTGRARALYARVAGWLLGGPPDDPPDGPLAGGGGAETESPAGAGTGPGGRAGKR